MRLIDLNLKEGQTASCIPNCTIEVEGNGMMAVVKCIRSYSDTIREEGKLLDHSTLIHNHDQYLLPLSGQIGTAHLVSSSWQAP
jgi:hypothetical protein